MIDDGEFAGVHRQSGHGSIGRTYRGDAARWHHEVGRHRHGPVAADGFSIFVGGPDGTRATVLSALRPAELPAWGWTLPVGGGTYHGLFPRAWQAFEPDVLGVRAIGEQLSPVIAGDLTRSALPVGAFEWWLENPGPDPLTVGLLFTWADPPAADGPPAHRPHDVVRAGDVVGISFGDPGDAAPTAMRGSLSIAALGDDGIELSARASFDPATDADLWADFAADGRLEPDGSGATPASVRASGAAVAATVLLAPGERRSIRFAIAWDLPMVEFGAGRRWWKRYTRDWGRSGLRSWDLVTHTSSGCPTGGAGSRPGRRLPRRPRPARLVQMALFNELYFLVDGGSFWERGRSASRSRRPIHRPVRAPRCLDYPF
jgi:non-lysosomal glucosylceramidase